MSLYQDADVPIRDAIEDAHAFCLRTFAEPGRSLDANTRLAVVRTARAAAGCALCARRAAALSPYDPGDAGTRHDGDEGLDPAVVEVVHRIATDSGRLTRTWFDGLVPSRLTAETYVELVGLVAQTVVIDTWARGLVLPVLSLPAAEPGQSVLTRDVAVAVVDIGAWVPVTDVEQVDTHRGLPTSPNISRALGLVPEAVEAFFGTFRPHYGLRDSDMTTVLDRSQIEFLAARVSSHNTCFY